MVPLQNLMWRARNFGSYDPYAKVVQCSLHFSYERRAKRTTGRSRVKQVERALFPLQNSRHNGFETERRRGVAWSVCFVLARGYFTRWQIKNLESEICLTLVFCELRFEQGDGWKWLILEPNEKRKEFLLKILVFIILNSFRFIEFHNSVKMYGTYSNHFIHFLFHLMRLVFLFSADELKIHICLNTVNKVLNVEYVFVPSWFFN